MKFVKQLAEHRYTRLAIGVAILITSAVDILEGCGLEMPVQGVGAEHGLLLFGIIKILQAVAEMPEGMHYIEQARTAPIENEA